MKHSALKLIASAIAVLSAVGVVSLRPPSALSQVPSPKPRPSMRRRPPLRNCPADVETLTALLLRDLPNYANRIAQRSRRGGKTANSNTMVLAGRPEFKPLTLGPGQYTPAPGAPEQPRQIFFTTLERQYADRKAVELQQFHWLFLTQTSSGWRLALMFSQIGSYPSKNPPTPSRESSNGVIGQGIRTWLEDCRAGAVRSL